jgi:YVTN family beta-propeller protein
VADDTSTSDITASPPGADIRTFLFADMRGYTRFTQQHGDHAASELAGRFADLVRDVVPTYEGELLELRGDEALSVFRSARQALRAAVEIQRRLRTGDADQPPFPLGVGMGLDAGEAIPTQGGFRGTSLNVAARLCGQAAPGQILATETVIALAARVDGLVFGSPRRLQVKGMADPVRAIDVRPETALPPAPTPPTAPRRHSRRLVGGAVVAAVAAAVVIAVVLESGGGTGARAAGVRVRPNTVAVLNPVSKQVTKDIPVGTSPWAIAAGFGAVWVADRDSSEVTRIDVKTMKAETFGVAGQPEAVATDNNYVWVYDPGDGKVFQIDPHRQPYGTVDTYRLHACGQVVGTTFVFSGCPGGRIAAGYHRVWVGDGQGHVWELNPNTRKWREVPGIYVPSKAVSVGNGFVYSTDSAHVAKIDPTTLHHQVRIVIDNEYAGHPTLGIDPTPSALWVVSQDTGIVCKCDPGTLAPVRKPGYQPSLNAVVVGHGSVWVTVESHGAILQLNPFNATKRDEIHIGQGPTDIAYADGKLWVTIQNPKHATNQL